MDAKPTPLVAFLESIRTAVAAEAWHAALSLSLALPDICGRIDLPQENSKQRYAKWFDANLGEKYTRSVGGNPHTFLTGNDCYALRCAYFHQGEFDTTLQRASKVLERFRFVVPPPSSQFHRNQIHNTLQLQVSVRYDRKLWMGGLIQVAYPSA